MERFDWSVVSEFINRDDELRRLDTWWVSQERKPIAMIGRRRVGKSWLFRRFAHGKPAVILVANATPAGAQMSRFAELLEPVVGARPDLRDVETLVRVAYRAAAKEKLLVVIDEFPLLLGSNATQVKRTLASLLAVMEEERDASKVKLVLCGSQVQQMESLFTDKNPMHGRLQRVDVHPLEFHEATGFLDALSPVDRFERYAIAGGMPWYLSNLGYRATSDGKVGNARVRDAVADAVLDHGAPLWSEGQVIIDEELRSPAVYFGVLEQLAGGTNEVNVIADRLREQSNVTSKYLATLANLGFVTRKEPFGAKPTGRLGRWLLDDPFLRFWFRFVFPYQDDLASGLAARDLFDNVVKGALADHVSPHFEQWCLAWLRQNRPDQATRYGTWWGNAVNKYRRTTERSSEEIDAVGAAASTINVVSEAKWISRPMSKKVLDDLFTYKIPALVDSGFKVAPTPRIVLFGKAGYSEGLSRAAAEDPNIELVDVPSQLDYTNRK